MYHGGKGGKVRHQVPSGRGGHCAEVRTDADVDAVEFFSKCHLSFFQLSYNSVLFIYSIANSRLEDVK